MLSSLSCVNTLLTEVLLKTLYSSFSSVVLCNLSLWNFLKEQKSRILLPSWIFLFVSERCSLVSLMLYLRFSSQWWLSFKHGSENKVKIRAIHINGAIYRLSFEQNRLLFTGQSIMKWYYVCVKNGWIYSSSQSFIWGEFISSPSEVTLLSPPVA